MARRVIIESDLSGETGATTVIFSLEGEHYEIDLTDQELATLAGKLDSYVKSGRKYRGGVPGADLEPVMTREERQAIRDWADATKWRDHKGNPVQPRGRVPKALIAAYDKAHGNT